MDGFSRLLKAELVRKFYNQFSEEFDSSGELPSLLKSHRLFTLAKTADLSMDRDEEDLLRRLTRAAVWSGRYPLPIEFNQLSGVEEFSDGRSWSVAYLGGTDIDRVRDLVEKIRGHFRL